MPHGLELKLGLPLTPVVGAHTRNEWKFQFVTGAGDLDVTPVITRHAGAGTATWFWGDGDSDVGDAPTHTYPGVGTYDVVLRIADINAALDEINFNNDGLVCTLASIPRTVTSILAAGEPDCAITGDLATAPATLVTLRLQDTDSVITGDLATASVTLAYLHLGNTDSVITGGGAVGCSGISEIQLQGCGMAQAQMDSIALWLYTYRASFTDGTPSMNMGGTNAAPGGLYQDGDPPTTGKEYIFEVVNDPEGEGFNVWTVTFTA